MLYLYWILLFLKNFLDYEKIDIRIHIFKRSQDNLTPTAVCFIFWLGFSLLKAFLQASTRGFIEKVYCS